MEVKKDGLRQMQDGCWKFTVTVHPNDMPNSLLNAPMGTRYGMALVEIGDDERPVPSQSKPSQASTSQRNPAATRAEKARRMCGVPAFQAHLIEHGVGGRVSHDLNSYEATSHRVKIHCRIRSKSELNTDPEAASKWDALLAEYEQATGRMATRTS